MGNKKKQGMVEVIDEDNPYAVDANSIETSPSSLKGIIRSPKNY